MASYFEILCGILALFLAVYYYSVTCFNFWKSRGVNGPRPTFLIGNTVGVMFAKVSLVHFLKGIYDEYKHEPLVGVYKNTQPVLIVQDPEIIKDVLIRDFTKFSDRGFTVHERAEPLSMNLLNLETKRWRPLRTKLTPMFTSNKLKDMFDLIVESADHLEKYLDKIVAQKKPVDFREVTARFTTDVVGSCAFGIEMSALENEQSNFRKIGRSIIDVNFESVVRLKLKMYVPNLYDLTGYIYPDLKFTSFFTKLVTDTIKYRQENNVYRPDFVQTLKEFQENPDISDNFKFTDTMLSAQAFIFFAAGFETSSTTMSNALYELALNQDIQDKLRKEIREHYAKHNGKLKYEHIKGMEYLDKVFKETLRKYPPGGVLLRRTTDNYTFKGMKLSIPKDLLLWIPVYALQHDPDIFPNPEVFNPENFSEEAIASRHPMTFLPFGDGPRNCIGARFATYQSKVGLIAFIRNYKFDVCEKTKIPYEFDHQAFLLAAKGGIYLNITKIET